MILLKTRLCDNVFTEQLTRGPLGEMQTVTVSLAVLSVQCFTPPRNAQDLTEACRACPGETSPLHAVMPVRQKLCSPKTERPPAQTFAESVLAYICGYLDVSCTLAMVLRVPKVQTNLGKPHHPETHFQEKLDCVHPPEKQKPNPSTTAQLWFGIHVWASVTGG